MWNCMCQGCGAPLQSIDLQCSYCLRATLPPPPKDKWMEVTQLGDLVPRYVLIEKGQA